MNPVPWVDFPLPWVNTVTAQIGGEIYAPLRDGLINPLDDIVDLLAVPLAQHLRQHGGPA